MKVDRSEEFAPVKNANGTEEVVDSPAQAKRMVMELNKRWLQNMETSANLEKASVEVDVMLSYAGEGKGFEAAVLNLQGDLEGDIYIK